jgi:hypothetical protein
MPANFAFFLLAVFLVAAVAGWEWPYIAKLMPIYVAAIPGVILIVLQLYREGTGWEERRDRKNEDIEMDEVYEAKLDKKIETRRTLIFFGWFIGGALGIWLLGIVIAIPLLVLLYTLIEGRERWSTSLLAAGCSYLLIWGLFEYLLDSRWPSGLLFR